MLFRTLILILTISVHCMASAPRMLLIDTTGNHAYRYATLLDLINQVGFKPTYVSYYDIDHKSLIQYQAVLVLWNPYVIEHKDHPLIHSVLAELQHYSERYSTMVILAFAHGTSFPDGTIMPSIENQTTAATQFLHQCTPLLRTMPEMYRDDLITTLNHFLKAPTKRNFGYFTSLLAPQTKVSSHLTYLQNMAPMIYNNSPVVAPLPLEKPTGIVRDAMPLAMLYINPHTRQKLCLTKIPLIAFADIEEPWFFTPNDPTICASMYQALQQTFYELFLAASNKLTATPGKITLPEKPSVPARPSISYRIPISCAWMDLAPDGNLNKEHAACLADAIKQTGMQILWIRFNPEEYLLSAEQSIRFNQKETYVHHLQLFSTALKNAFADNPAALPKIFVGLDLTGNYEKVPVPHPVYTIYGQRLSALPSPVDLETFWKPQVVDALKAFVDIWRNPTIESGLPLSGVFFDFEMYHTQPYAQNTKTKMQPALYDNMMDLGDYAWNYYVQQHQAHHAQQATTVEKRVDYLQHYHLFTDYFATLEKRMTQIGTYLYKEIQSILPGAQIAAYLPTLPSNWIYTGLLRGLNDKKHPLLLATLNSSFFPHVSTLMSQQIWPYHLGIVLLSRLQKPEDAQLLKNVNSQHDGIWYNRFSWICTPYQSNAWWSNEATPMDKKEVIKLIHAT